VQRLEPALHGTWPDRRPGPNRPGDALKVSGPEVLKFKQVSEKSSRAFGNDDHARFSDPLQACREVRGIADDAALLRFS